MNTIASVAIAAAIIAVAVVGYMQSEKAIKTQAIDGCYQTAQISVANENGQTVTTPENYWFDQCMKEKGYK